MTVQAKTPDEIRCLKAHEKRERKSRRRRMQVIRMDNARTLRDLRNSPLFMYLRESPVMYSLHIPA